MFVKKALKKKKPLDLPGIEDSLQMTLAEVLSVMQHQIKKRTMYFGVRAIKNPLDFWVYREIIWDVKPDILIEIGNRFGGSTLALAHVLDNIGKGCLIGIDINHDEIPRQVKMHPRITLLTGDACGCFDRVEQLIRKKDKVLIIEDSAHTYQNTLNVLNKFSPLVSRNSYFIVEDTIGHHGVDEGPKPGSYEAVEDFVKNNEHFKIDRTQESFFITWNPKGFLKRIK